METIATGFYYIRILCRSTLGDSCWFTNVQLVNGRRLAIKNAIKSLKSYVYLKKLNVVFIQDFSQVASNLQFQVLEKTNQQVAAVEKAHLEDTKSYYTPETWKNFKEDWGIEEQFHGDTKLFELTTTAKSPWDVVWQDHGSSFYTEAKFTGVDKKFVITDS
jgi:hypothetical protein